MARAVRERWRQRLRRYRADSDDDGSAMVEFVFLTLLFLVPLVYLVVTLSRIQAGAFAAESAAHDSARATVVTGVEARESGASSAAAMEAGAARAQAAVALAAENFGFEADDAALTLTCDGQCLQQGSNVEAQVTVTVALPGIPGFVSAAIPLAVEVTGSARSPVDSLRTDS